MKTKTSEALLEVWQMKDAAYEETMHLKGASYFSYIHKQIAKSLSGANELPKILFPSAAHAANFKADHKKLTEG